MASNYDQYGDKLVNDSAHVVFKCPNCGESEIGRSRKARELGKEYTCPKCGFVGP
jgi:hypothetical protein